MEQFTIEGIYDIDPEVLESKSKATGLKAFSSYEEMILNCGAVLIATPTSSHFDYAEPAIRQGKHVFIEKPITGDLKQARKLLKMAEEAGVIIQVGHVERFNPAYRAITDRSIEPRFIESHRLAQFDVRGTDVSVVLDLMIHDIDIVLSLVNGNVRRVFASGVCVVTNNIDLANARLEFDNGTVANLTASRISFKRMRKMRVFQQHEYLGIDFLNKKVDVFRLTKDGEAGGIPLSADEDSPKVMAEQPRILAKDAIREELLAFYRSIRAGREIDTNVSEATRALELAEIILKKISKNGQRL